MEVAKQHRPPRVLYVITKANWGGAQRYVYDLATAAKNKGFTVLVATGAEGELTERLREAGVEVAPIEAMQRDIHLGAEFKSFFELLRIVRAFTPDVVHANSSKAGGLAGLAARICGVKRIIFTAHGWAFNERRPAWQRFLIWLLHYATVLLSHTTICVSSAMRDEAHMPFVASKLRVVHNGIEPFELLPRDAAREAVAPSVTLPFWVGTIAELHPTKQLEILIRAFSLAHAKLPDAALVIIGEGEERARLEQLVHILSLTESVFFAGHVAEARTYLKALDLFVLPSRSESFGFVLLEAGIAGLPVIASNVGGIPEIIEDGVTGALAPSGDKEALAAAIATLAEDAPLRDREASALHERVIRDFSKQGTLDKTFALYD